LYDRLVRVFTRPDTSIEIIFVDDCSPDASWNVICELARHDRRVKGVRMNRNFGQHNAILCGIRRASGEIIVTIDDDLEHRPEEIPTLIDRLHEGFDVVYGPPEREQHGPWRNVASVLTKWVLKEAMGAANAPDVNALRVFRTRLRDGFSGHNAPSVNIDVLLSWSTSSFSSVRVRHDARQAGVSGYTIGKLYKHAFNMITGYSTKPLQFASILGFSMALFGIGVLAYIITLWLVQGSIVPGFYFLVSVISIFSGSNLIALGIFGEYLARIYGRTMDRPQYVISEQI
jgi:undecaprenyl-phosphate 4-deoxy-4-formamido-L-arabinose transferase